MMVFRRTDHLLGLEALGGLGQHKNVSINNCQNKPIPQSLRLYVGF